MISKRMLLPVVLGLLTSLQVQAQSVQSQPLSLPGVNTSAVEYGISFVADGDIAVFTRNAPEKGFPAIYEIRKDHGQWLAPQIARFSGQYSDEHPFITPDGSRIYFSSKRPHEGTEPKAHNDLWFVDKQGDDWGTPVRMPEPLNGDHIDAHPFIDQDGTLYFHSLRNDPAQKVDIYAAASNGSGLIHPSSST